MQPFISILLPVYNSEYYLPQALNSLLVQTFDAFEILVVDDASTDSTPAILRTYSDPRIRLLRNETNRGPYFSRNRAAALARGRYLCIADADDVSFPGRLESQFRYLEAHPGQSACGCRYSAGYGRTAPELPENYETICLDLMDGLPLMHATLLIRSEAMQATGGYNPHFLYASDYEFCCRLALKGKITNLTETLVHCRVHDRRQSEAFRPEREYLLSGARRRYILEQIRRILPPTSAMPEEADVAFPPLGRIIYTYIHARKTGEPDLQRTADKQLEALLAEPVTRRHIGLGNGWCGMGCGLLYLEANGYIRQAGCPTLERIDRIVSESYPMLEDPGFFLGTAGLDYYRKRRTASAQPV